MIQKDIKTAQETLEALPATTCNLLLKQYVSELIIELREAKHNLHISYCRIDELEKMSDSWKALADSWKDRCGVKE